MAIEKKMSERLEEFKEEFGRVLDPVAFIERKNEELCDAFLKLHGLTVNDGALPRKFKLLMHAAITAAQHDPDATAMHLMGAIRAGATEEELLETGFTVIPVSGMPSFAIFLQGLTKAKTEARQQTAR